ncbi:hypothetical protein BSKO_02383 [Bryopsis sp. KO-2023]|nr:hypothetical protein BSKO_02383 [Bryopsis sp. KO-2023]
MNPLIGRGPWHRISLKFQDPQLESRFLSYASNVWMNTEYWCAVFCLSMIGFKPWMFPTTFVLYPRKFWLLTASQGVFVALFHVVLAKKRPETFMKHRVLISSCTRFVVTLVTTLLLSLDSPNGLPTDSARELILAIISRTSIMTCFLLALGLRIPFRRDFLVQSICMVIAAWWIPGFCAQCSANPSVQAMVDGIGSAMHEIMATLTILGLPIPRLTVEGDSSMCLIVGLFFHLWVGLFIPTLILYWFECTARSAYLFSTSPSEETGSRIRSYKSDGLILLALLCCYGTQGLWFGLNYVIPMALKYVS